MNEKTVQELTQRHLGKVITITNIPNLPMPLTKWSKEGLNHFDALIGFSYEHHLSEISWNSLNKKGKEQ